VSCFQIASNMVGRDCQQPLDRPCLPAVSLIFIQIRFVHLTDLGKNTNCLHVSHGGRALV
jgi:hypothetical protein